MPPVSVVVDSSGGLMCNLLPNNVLVLSGCSKFTVGTLLVLANTVEDPESRTNCEAVVII